MNIQKFCIVFVTFFVCVLTIFVNAESKIDWVKLTPELADSDESDIALGLKFDLNPKNKALIDNETLTLNYIIKGEWASEGDVNTEPIEAKVDISFDWMTFMPKGDIYYYGYFNAGYASDDRFKEQELAGGITLSASYETSFSFKFYLLGHYNLIYSFESEHRDQLGVSDADDFGRLELESLILLRLRKLINIPIVKNLKLSGNYRYFNQHSLDNEIIVSGEDNFDYIKLDLAYEWWSSGVFGLVQEAFISYSYGHLPTQTEDQAVWKMGFVLYGAE